MFEFEWDPAKAFINERKHGISFDDAAGIFGDTLLLSMLDNEHSDLEQRWISHGQSRRGQLLVVIHTYHEIDESTTAVRIISARPATSRERRNYERRR